LEEVSRLSISDDQILVRVHDAGVNPIDWKIRQGFLKQLMPVSFPLTIGQDFAGEVMDRGKAVERFRNGDRVFGFAQGAYAEYAAAPESAMAAIPDSIDYPTAAALPTAGLTALQIIRDVIHAKPGMTVIIHGAAGGVGSFASQIAKTFGAKVTGTATGEDIRYLNSLGIHGVIDSTREHFEARVHDLDAVVDLVGGETLTRSYAVVKKGGTLVTTVGQIDDVGAKRAGIRATRIVVKRSSADLAELASLVEKGAVKPRVAQTMSPADAKKAQVLGERGGTHGKRKGDFKSGVNSI